MKRSLTALGVLVVLTQASAADLAPTLWNYVTGKGVSAPIMDRQTPDGLVFRMWVAPTVLQAEGVGLIYMPKVSTYHWMVAVVGAAAPLKSYAGSAALKLFKSGTAKSGNKVNIYLIEGGMYKGLLIGDTISTQGGESTRMVMLFTPQMVDQAMKPLP